MTCSKMCILGYEIPSNPQSSPLKIWFSCFSLKYIYIYIMSKCLWEGFSNLKVLKKTESESKPCISCKIVCFQNALCSGVSGGGSYSCKRQWLWIHSSLNAPFQNNLVPARFDPPIKFPLCGEERFYKSLKKKIGLGKKASLYEESLLTTDKIFVYFYLRYVDVNKMFNSNFWWFEEEEEGK